jgi:N-acylneuraminate cytidylyltransferase
VRVAVIPARGGSKRLPGKNIRRFAGKPMIAYSIECALRSGLFDRVIVSTDDSEIAGVAIEHGAETPFVRPPELSDDHAGTTEVVAHAVQFLQQQASLTAVCCIYATAPFIDSEDLSRGWSLLQAGDWQYVFSATTFAFPIFRSFRRTESHAVQMFFPEHFTTRSQDLPEAMHDAGQFYWGRPQAWLEHRIIFGDRSTVVAIPRWRVQDIDTAEDWHRAETLALALGWSVAPTHSPK